MARFFRRRKFCRFTAEGVQEQVRLRRQDKDRKQDV